MTSVGDRLRRERIRQGVDLAQLSRDTRINLKYLDAIEAGDPSRIPGGFFYRSFVRQYALALGMNAAELETDLDRVREAEAPVLSAALEAAPFPLKELDPIVVATNRRLASGRTWAYVLMLVGVVAGCSTFYSWWHRYETRTQTVAQSSAAPAVVSASRTPVDTVASTIPDTPPVAAGTSTAALIPVSNDGAPTADDKVVLEVSAREKTWLTVRADGKTIFSGVLEPSQTKILGGKVRAYIKVGNAAGLEITWNGKQIGPLGERGQVKTVLFTPENFQIQPSSGSL